MPKIFVLTGPDVGHTFEVQPGAVFGRAEDCTVRLTDASVSRHHARLEHTAAGFAIVDLGSRNGVFWDGERVERVTLEEGREFTLGEVVLKFRSGASAKPAAAATAITDEEIVLEGEWDESKAPPPAADPAAMTAFTQRAPVQPAPRPAAAPARPAPNKTAEKLVAAGVAPQRDNAGARGVLQYNKVESRAGLLQADFDQQPLWVKILLLFAVLVVVAGVSWLAFRAVILLRGSTANEPVVESTSEEAR
jgi:hypothetical protein